MVDNFKLIIVLLQRKRQDLPQEKLDAILNPAVVSRANSQSQNKFCTPSKINLERKSGLRKSLHVHN